MPQSQSTAISPAAPGVSSVIWGYLFVIASAELVTSALDPQLGLILHALILIVVLLNGGVGRDERAGELVFALALAPLIRILSLSLPLEQFPRLAWYPLVAVPVLAATVIVARQLRLTPQTLGLCIGNLPLQLMVAGVGFPLGVIEYGILKPEPILVNFEWRGFWLQVLNLFVFAGLAEEIIFRGLLQSLALRVLGRSALVFVSLLFAVLNMGYHALSDVFFVFAVGMIFAYLVLWSGSILGVTLAHGLTNITLFLIMPYLGQSDDPGVRILAAVTLGIGTAMAIIATTAFFRGAAAKVDDVARNETPGGRVSSPLRGDDVSPSAVGRVENVAHEATLTDVSSGTKGSTRRVTGAKLPKWVAAFALFLSIMPLLAAVLQRELLSFRDMPAEARRGSVELVLWIVVVLASTTLGVLARQPMASAISLGSLGGHQTGEKRFRPGAILALVGTLLAGSIVTVGLINALAPEFWRVEGLGELGRWGLVVVLCMVVGGIVIQAPKGSVHPRGVGESERHSYSKPILRFAVTMLVAGALAAAFVNLLT